MIEEDLYPEDTIKSPEQKRPLKIGILRRSAGSARNAKAKTKIEKSVEDKFVKDEATSSEQVDEDQDQTSSDVQCIVCSDMFPFSETLPVPKQVRERSAWSDALSIPLTYRDRLCHKHFSPNHIVRKVYKGKMVPHVRRGAMPKLLPSSESVEEEIKNVTATNVSLKRKRQMIQSRSARKNETLVIPKDEVIDRGYYYVKRSRKQKMTVTPEASSPSDQESEPECRDSEYDEYPTMECPPINESVEGFSKMEEQDSSSESGVESKFNDQSSKDAITSINDLLSSALLDVDQPNNFSPVVDEISFNKNFISNECPKITCRQLSSRLSLLQRERERLNRLRDLLLAEVDLLQQRVEKMTDGDDTADTTCLSCADGRLEAFFQSNLARVKMLREKAAHLRHNVGLK